jgi:hypothetical protein
LFSKYLSCKLKFDKIPNSSLNVLLISLKYIMNKNKNKKEKENKIKDKILLIFTLSYLILF